MESALKITSKTLLSTLGALATTLTCSIASAQGAFWTITYGNQQSVPTLSEWGMIVLSLALTVFAVAALRKKGVGKPLASFVLLTGLALVGMIGNSVIRNAEASTGGEMLPSDGGTVSIFGSGGGSDVPVLNSTGSPQTIRSVSPVSNPATDSGHVTCAAGVTVSVGERCYVNNGMSPG